MNIVDSIKTVEAEAQKLEDGACTGRGITFYSSVVVVHKRIFGNLFKNNNVLQRAAAHAAAVQSGILPAPPRNEIAGRFRAYGERLKEEKEKQEKTKWIKRMACCKRCTR